MFDMKSFKSSTKHKLMKRISNLLLIILLASFTNIVNAQSNAGTIRGKVIDGSQKIIESATITLFKTADSTVVKMNVADKSGKFEFENIAPGKIFCFYFCSWS